MNIRPYLCFLVIVFSCPLPANGLGYPWLAEGETTDDTLYSRHPSPAGYQRVSAAEGSFAHFLRYLPLKPLGAFLHLHNGQPYEAAYAGAIIDLDMPSGDLQQCADTLIRLFAEYRYLQGAAETLTFNFTSGDAFAYKDYLAGQRPIVSGREVSWHHGAASVHDRAAFRHWLDIVFLYAGTASLARDLPKTSISDVQVGDLFISPGFPGHTVMIADMALNEAGDRKILLVQGFTPAQNAHVVRNGLQPHSGDWYDLRDDQDLVTPVWRFSPDQLHRMQ